MAKKAKKAARPRPKAKKKAQAVKSARKKKTGPQSRQAAERDRARDRRQVSTLKPQVENTVREISLAWQKNIPPHAAASGAFDFAAEKAHVPEQHPVGTATHKDVPNGKYRVEGMDWIIELKGGKVVNAERARSDADPADYITVPAVAVTQLGPEGGPNRRMTGNA